VPPAAGGLGGLDLFVATRTTPSSTFVLGGALQNTDTAAADETEPFVREDGQVLYFTSNATGAGDLYRSTRSAALSGPLAGHGAQHDVDRGAYRPVTADDLVIYFSSTRADGGALEGRHLGRDAELDEPSRSARPRNVAELNTTSGERPDFITRDRCTLYFTGIRHRCGGDRARGLDGSKSPWTHPGGWADPFSSDRPSRKLMI